MKKVSIRSNAYSEYCGYIGARRETSFSCEWDAMEWLTLMVNFSHEISLASNFTLADVQEHIKKTR